MDYIELMMSEAFVVDSLGWLGAFCFLVSYYLLISKRWRSDSFPYHLLNILGGLFVAINTYYYQSIPGAFINIAWAGIAIYGMVNDRRARKPAATSLRSLQIVGENTNNRGGEGTCSYLVKIPTMAE